MKRILFFLLWILIIKPATAQNLPEQISINVLPFEYKMSKGTLVTGLLGVAASPDKPLFIPEKSMVPQMNEAISAAPSQLPWVLVSSDSSAAKADYTLKGVITKSEISTLEKNPGVHVDASVTLVDNRTGKNVATKTCNGWSGGLDVPRDVAEAKAYAASRLTRSVVAFILEALPITGSILEKGVEQANGKTKEKQCYVDLGSQHGIYKDMLLYVTESGKYKAELKVIEIMADDLCTCKVTKGDSYVTKSLEKGVELVVTSKPKN